MKKVLTESQEGSEDTDELHCGCGGGWFVCRKRSEWVGLESRSNGEEWGDWRALPILKYLSVPITTPG